MQENNLPWWQKTVVYQIYPRSFNDSNNDGIGDIKGIILKLDYINSLGVETIWLSPFYESPQKDFGYDISNYRSIAPEYGTMDDVKELIAKVHQRGMKIVLDMVMNHTSDQHVWFQESKKSKGNPKSDWYIWKDGKGGKAPNNWKNIVWGKGWHYSPERDQWYYASFLPFQPDLNYRNPEVKKEMFDTVRFWLNLGVDGFRLDIFNCILKDELFRDNPWSPNPAPSPEWPGGNFQKRKYSVNQADNFALAQELRAVMDEYGAQERFLIGEVFGSQDVVKKYLGKGDGLHLIFLFETMYFKWSAKWFGKTIMGFEKEFPSPLIPTWVLGNHDIYRYSRRINNDLNRAKLISLIQLTVRAVPTMYYGEEIGMVNGQIERTAAQDPMAAEFKWLPNWFLRLLPVSINRDVCRTPMQWNDNKNAGFSDTRPWLDVTDQYESRNVATMSLDENSLLNWYKKVIALRKDYSALHQGSLKIISSEKNILVYERIDENMRLRIVVNFSKSQISQKVQGEILLSSSSQTHLTSGILQVDALSGVVIQLAGV
ncbi:MAG: alpha-glucosidase [Chitinophagales bacterium]|nr:alpha-glucosidase [Chitinophagales bacterium]